MAWKEGGGQYMLHTVYKEINNKKSYSEWGGIKAHLAKIIIIIIIIIIVMIVMIFIIIITKKRETE